MFSFPCALRGLSIAQCWGLHASSILSGSAEPDVDDFAHEGDFGILLYWRYTVSKGSRLVPLCFSCIFTTAIKWAYGLWLGRCIVGLLKLLPPNLLSFIVPEGQNSLHALTLTSLHTSYVSIGNKLTFSLFHMIPLWCSYISMESRIDVSLRESTWACCYYCSFTIVQTFATISLL